MRLLGVGVGEGVGVGVGVGVGKGAVGGLELLGVDLAHQTGHGHHSLELGFGLHSYGSAQLVED